MINFIVVEDNHFFNDKIINIIQMYMSKIKLDYKIYSFFDYSEKVYDFIENDSLTNKIYILDIECPSGKGTDAARKIRNIDIKSFIIFITAYYNKYQQVMLSNYFMFLAFINKKDDYEKDLENALNIGVLKINDNNIIRISQGSLRVTLEKKDILYVYIKERRTYVVTTYQIFDTSMTLQDMILILGKNFMYCHKSIIINIENVKNIISKNREIYFDPEHYVIASKGLIKEVIKQFKLLCVK